MSNTNPNEAAFEYMLANALRDVSLRYKGKDVYDGVEITVPANLAEAKVPVKDALIICLEQLGADKSKTECKEVGGSYMIFIDDKAVTRKISEAQDRFREDEMPNHHRTGHSGSSIGSRK